MAKTEHAKRRVPTNANCPWQNNFIYPALLILFGFIGVALLYDISLLSFYLSVDFTTNRKYLIEIIKRKSFVYLCFFDYLKNIEMNLALNKKILETDLWKKSENSTDGNFVGIYSYTETTCPNYFTLDLEQIFEIAIIRFLLYDRDIRNYKYRLLTSTDMHTWTVHSDTLGSSWQNFEFNEKINVRYIRLHCLWNSKNESFHIGEIEAYKNKISIHPKETLYIINNLTATYEISDGLPISRKLQPLVKTINEIPAKFPGLDKEYFADISTELEKGIYDVEKIEKGMESIRRQIIEPVQKELTVSNSIGKWSIWLGLIGGLLGIFSLLNSIFKWIE